MTEQGWRIGCDIGGTFTDFLAINPDTGAIVAEKRLTSPDDPSRAVGEGLQALREKAVSGAWTVEKVVHGTTLVINALIQHMGARVGLLSTEGFADIIEMRREVRYDSYDLFLEFPKLLAERPDRLGVRERVLADGRVHRPLDEEHAREQIRRLLDAGVESIAVCLLHAYANPVHERRLRELILKIAPDAFVSLSSDVLPEIREYERTVATAANAFVQPQVARYLDRMLDRMETAGCGGKLHLMLSNGGLSSVETARSLPLRLVESGPAAGGMAAEYFARTLGRPHLLSFDMGGTTAKSVLIKNARVSISSDCEVARIARFKKGSGIPLKLPFVDLLEIGAGGGSIAHVSAMGLLQVGPDSAGSAPGPVCYGRGGAMPTVTDADLLLGYLDADYFLGGEMKLDKARTRAAVQERLAPLNLPPEQAAWRIHDLVNENMAAAAKIHLAEKGEMPQALSMIAFGGAGPLHAVGVARKLGIAEVIIPPWAGVLSAVGFFAAPVSFDLTATYRSPLATLDTSAVAGTLARMRADIARFLATPENAITFETEAELRYAGQGFGVSIALPPGVEQESLRETLVRLFEQNYSRVFGRIYPDVAPEITGLHVTGRLITEPFQLPAPEAGASMAKARKGTRLAFSPSAQALVPHEVYERLALPVDAVVEGPAIIEERECTTVVGEHMTVRVHASGALIVALPESPRN